MSSRDLLAFGLGNLAALLAAFGLVAGGYLILHRRMTGGRSHRKV